MQNIIFLDIDGVMKPARCYLDPRKKAVFHGGLDELSVAAVNRLAERFDASIVFNTTWNLHFETKEQLKNFAKDNGITANIAGKTAYPTIEKRLDAIHNWIGLHPDEEINWVALDDCSIASKRAVLINPQVGITIDDYIQATEILGNKDSFIVLI